MRWGRRGDVGCGLLVCDEVVVCVMRRERDECIRARGSYAQKELVRLVRLGEREKKVYKPLYRSGAFLQPTLHFFGYKFNKTANQRPPTLEYLPNLNVRKRGLPLPPNPNHDITLGARAFRATASKSVAGRSF